MIFYREDIMMRLDACIEYLLQIRSSGVIRPLIYLWDVYIKINSFHCIKKR